MMVIIVIISSVKTSIAVVFAANFSPKGENEYNRVMRLKEGTNNFFLLSVYISRVVIYEK